VLRVLAQQPVDVGAVVLDAAQQLERVLVRLDREIVEQLDNADVTRLELVTESQCSFSGLPPRRHVVVATRA
jgi:hypothetical protein